MKRSWTIGGFVLLASLATALVGVASGVSEGASVVLVTLPVLAALLALIGSRSPRRHISGTPVIAPDRENDEALTREAVWLRAAEAERFREEFVAAVSHELKTPLNAILGFTQVMLDELDGPLTPQQREDVVAIRQAGLYLSELVEGLLEEWAPRREVADPLPSVELEPVLQDVARLLEGQTMDAEVAIHVVVAPDVPSPRADARRLRQVLVNLGTNALRATRRGSVTLEAAPHRDGVRITVRDTGTGIDPELVPRLFDEFVQGSRQSTGSGFGLALSRDLVEWHGGRIEVETERGVGTAFHVFLPLEPE